jgi:adenylate cyclase
MVEDIITALSRFKSLFVIARNSSFTYKGKAVDVKQVSRELGVRYVLEGSVRKASERVRITGQLIDAVNAVHLWADKFDGTLDDIFDLQDRITSSVVGAIAPKLQLSELERVKRKPTENPTAYDYYLRGLSNLYQFKKEAMQEAGRLFKKAIELDPEFAAPYAAAAWRYVGRQAFGWGPITSEEMSEVVALAHRAVELDNDDATVLSQAACALAILTPELDAGAALIERAVTANPNLAIAWGYRGWIDILVGNPECAIDDFKHALRLSPLDPVAFFYQSGLGLAYVFSDQYVEAARWAAEAAAAVPDWLGAHRVAIICHASSGDIEAAKASWEIAQKLEPTQRISQARLRLPLRREADYAKLVQAFRLVGMPE